MPRTATSTGVKKKTVTSSKRTSPKSNSSKSAVKKPSTAATKKRKAKISEEDIRLAAYFNYLNRGCTNGQHEGDWYEAEKSLKKN